MRKVQTVNFGRIVESILGRQRAPTLIQEKFKNIDGGKKLMKFIHSHSDSLSHSTTIKIFAWFLLINFHFCCVWMNKDNPNHSYEIKYVNS